MKVVEILLVINILCLLIILYYNKKSYLSVTPHTYAPSSDNIFIGEVYTYPCVGCLSYNNKVRPLSKYNTNHNRCFMNTTLEFKDNVLESVVNYKTDPPSYYYSCTGIWDTRYSYVSGRYILIIRNFLGAGGYKINHISVYTKDNNQINNNDMFIYCNKSYNDPYLILNSSDLTSRTYSSYIVGISPLEYIYIDLGNTYDVGRIRIVHKDTNDANTLLKSIVAVYNESGVLVFSKLLNDAAVDRNIYIQNYIENTSVTDSYKPLSLYYGYDPFCYNTINNTLFKGCMYYFDDLRCFSPKTNNISVSDLDTMKNMLNKLEVPKIPGTLEYIAFNNFNSCSIFDETRLLPSSLIMIFDVNIPKRCLSSAGLPVGGVIDATVTTIVTSYNYSNKPENTFTITNTGLSNKINKCDAVSYTNHLPFLALKIRSSSSIYQSKTSYGLVNKTIYIVHHMLPEASSTIGYGYLFNQPGKVNATSFKYGYNGIQIVFSRVTIMTQSERTIRGTMDAGTIYVSAISITDTNFNFRNLVCNYTNPSAGDIVFTTPSYESGSYSITSSMINEPTYPLEIIGPIDLIHFRVYNELHNDSKMNTILYDIYTNLVNYAVGNKMTTAQYEESINKVYI